MLVTILMGLVGGLTSKALCMLIWKFWAKDFVDDLPIKFRVKLNETDNKKAEETVELIHDKFGEDVVSAVASESEEKRIEMMADFTKELATLYGLDIDIDITVTDAVSWGCFNDEENKVVFNFAALMTDATDENFGQVVFEVIDTIIHELRHAVQYKAISDPTFWDIGNKRAKRWKSNMKNYIRAGVDPEGHSRQPVEADASTFTALIMDEVK